MGYVSVQRVEARSGPSLDSPRVAALARGSEIRLRGASGGFVRASLPGGREGWLPDGSFERADARAERERRTAATAKFPAQPGRVVEPTQLFLAPDYGGALYGGLEDRDDLDVVLTDHDFYGVRLSGGVLAFVPARSVRLMPPRHSEESHPEAAEGSPAGAAPALPGVRETPPAAVSSLPEPARPAPLESLPAEAEPPVLVKRVDPKYPEFAKKAGLSGDVQLKVLVEADGHISRVEVLTGAPGGMTEAATEAVRKWIYQPARVAGRAAAVWKVVRVHFALAGRETTGEEKPPL